MNYEAAPGIGVPSAGYMLAAKRLCIYSQEIQETRLASSPVR